MAQGLEITVLTTVYHPDPTGTSVYATAVAEHLASQGNRVQVVTTVPHYPQWQIRPEYRGVRHAVDRHNEVRIDRLRVYVPQQQTVLRRAAYEGSFVAHALVSRKLLRHSPDLVLAFVPNVANAAVGLYWARRHRAPLVTFVQDVSSVGASESGVQGGNRVSGLIAKVESYIAESSAVVTVCSDTFRRQLEATGVTPERIVSFPNWSRLPEPSGDRDTERRRRGWKPDDIVVLHAGNLGMKQRMDLVGDYAKEALHRGTKVRFVIVGDGSQRNEILQRTEGLPNVEYVPPVDEEELPDLLAAADILFLHERPGLLEMSVPSKLTAYFSVARPVVAAVEEAGPAAKLVMDSGGGLVTPAGEPSSLVSLLVELGSDPDRMTKLGEAGRAYAEKEMSTEAAMARLDAIVERALVRKTGAVV